MVTFVTKEYKINILRTPKTHETNKHRTQMFKRHH